MIYSPNQSHQKSKKLFKNTYEHPFRIKVISKNIVLLSRPKFWLFGQKYCYLFVRCCSGCKWVDGKLEWRSFVHLQQISTKLTFYDFHYHYLQINQKIKVIVINYCQAQPTPHLQPQLWLRLVLVSIPPKPPTHPSRIVVHV